MSPFRDTLVPETGSGYAMKNDHGHNDHPHPDHPPPAGDVSQTVDNTATVTVDNTQTVTGATFNFSATGNGDIDLNHVKFDTDVWAKQYNDTTTDISQDGSNTVDHSHPSAG